MLTTTLAGKTACRLGFGCFPLTGGYGDISPAAAFRTIQAVLDAGVRILDTSDAYAAGANEELVGRAVADRRESAVVVTKFGWVLDSFGNPIRRDGSPAYIRKACEASLRRLKTDYIDVYLQHRVDPGVSIEETIGELARLREAGKVRGFGLCEVSPGTLRRAAAVAPLAVLQTEYSLWAREPAAELLPACDALGIAFMAYSPLGRGFLAGAIRSPDQLGAADFRRSQPRFEGANLQHNLRAVNALGRLADRYGMTRSQLCLAWLLNQSPGLIPIPSTRSIEHFEENLRALEMRLTSSQVTEVEEEVRTDQIEGLRHPADHMKTIDL